MGEGYRIVAASRGLRSEEKQAITKLSPSHDALCWQPGASSFAAAYYPLPSGRVCVALSCHAGAEHTGRGGHRVYTHNVIFEEAELAAWGYNPFHVVRSMIAADLGTPQLSSGGTLGELALNVEAHIPAGIGRAFALTVEAERFHCILDNLFSERALIVPVGGNWVETAEMLLLSLPGPLRSKLSFAAGLRFALSRSHRLNVLYDEKETAKARIVGQPVTYVDTEAARQSTPALSAWATFVQRHLTSGEAEKLARRTSLAFPDIGPVGRERVGRLYNAIDTVAQTTTADLLSTALRCLSQPEGGVVEGIRRELLSSAHRELSMRLAKSPWREIGFLWPQLIAAAGQGPQPREFVQLLLVQALRAALQEDALVAAEIALGIESESDPDMRAAVDDVLRRLAAKAHAATGDPNGRLANLCERWRSLRPSCPLVQQLCRLAQTREPALGTL